MATLGQIKAEAKRIIEEEISELTDVLSTHVQRAQRAIEDRCEFAVQDASATFEVVPTTYTYALPSDFIAVRAAPRYMVSTTISGETAGNSVDRVFLEEAVDFASLGNVYETGRPKYWREDAGANIEFHPRGDSSGPGASASYEVQFPYHKRLATLTNDGDSNWWSDNMDDVLGFRTAALVLAEMRDPLSNYWDQRAVTRLKEIRSQTKRNLLRSRATQIVPSQPISGQASRFKRRTIVARVPS